MTENKETSKDFKKFEKSLNNILNSSSGAASWSDLLPFAKEVFQLFDKRKDDFNFTLLPEKNTLSKRLAQCLNPECPGGVHEVVINIYSMILQNILSKNDGKLAENLGIYSSGLFPFFSYATIPNKVIFLEKIISSCFLKLEQNELDLCLPGLLSSLIPGLDDNNEDISQKIYSIFDEIRKKMRPGIFYGTYWSLLLKNKLLRPSGIKYLYEKMIKYYEYEALNEEEKKVKLEDEFPNINNLVVNSLCQLIEEDDIPTVRTSMDFIILRLPLTKENTMLNDKAKIVLITSALRLLIKNDYSTTRRLSNWLLGTSNPEDEVDFKSPDIIYKMELVVQAFKNMFNSTKLINSDNLKDYIKILDQFLVQQIEFSDFVLSRIAYDLILCFINFWQNELNSSENAIKNDTIKKLNNFFHKDNNYVDCLWKSIGNYLESTLDRKDLEFDKNDYNSVKNIEVFIFQTVQPLKFCFLFIDLQSNDERVKHYIPIINNLLKIMNKLVFQKRDQIQKVRHILSTTLVFTKSLQEKILSNNPVITFTNNNSDSNLIKVDNKFSKRSSLFATLNEDTNEDANNEKGETNELEKTEETNEIYSISEQSSLNNILTNKNYESIMSSLKETIENYQTFYIKLLEEFLKIKSKSQVTKNEIFIFRNATELMIRLQEYSQIKELPKWIQYIEKIIFNLKGNAKLSLEAANSLLDLNLSSLKGHEIYEIIKKNFSEEEIDSSIIDPDYLKKIISKTKVNNNCQELLMGKLYINLDDQSNRKEIIDIMIKISKLDQKKFINIMENTFKTESLLEDSLKFFSDFWQLLYEHYDNYPFFKKGECVLQMVDYLDSNNPLLRHLSKSWLDQSFKQFNIIIEPILLSLLDENIEIIQSEKDQHFYAQKEYDTKIIINSFGRLKSLIINSPIMKFLLENKPNEEILGLFEAKKNLKLDEIDINYLHILIAISLKFTQGRSKEDFSEAFKLAGLSINASSCEFLEFLLSHVNNPEIIMKYANKLNLPILTLIDEAIDNNNGVMQLQLLAVLKVFYFTTAPIHLKYKSDAFLLFSNQSLINCLTKGMTRDYFFVRENFINFTRECLPCLKRIMDDEEGKTTYFKYGSTFIAALNQYLANRITIDVKGRRDTERFSHFDDRNNVNYFIFKNYLDEYKEYKLYDEGDVLLILKGIKDITFHFLNIEPNKKEMNEFWPEFKNNLIETQKVPSGFFFGLFAGDDTQKNELDKNVKGLFSSQIMNLLNSLLLTWTNKSDKYEPYDYCVNVNGILPLKKANKEIFSDKDITNGLESVKKKPLKKIVREIAFNLFLTNPLEFMETIIRIWCFSSTKKPKNIDITIDAQYKLTIIEFLISLDIPLNIILYCLNIIIQKNIKLEKEREKKKKYIKYQRDPKKKCFITSHIVGVFEAKLIHLLYSYILLNPFIELPLLIYNKDQTRNEICESWKEMISFINTIISDTKIIYTYCWVYELLQITLAKFPLDKVFDANTKNRLIEIFNLITDKLTNCVFNDKTDSKHVDEDKLILPYLPHIYLNMVKAIYPESLLYLYNKVIDPGQNQSLEETSVLKSNDPLKKASKMKEEKLSSGINSKVHDFYTLYYSASKLCTERVDLNSTPCSNGDYLNMFYRQIACITLKENFYQILNNLYSDPNLYKKNLTEIIRQLINFLKANSQNSQEDKMFFAEFASEFLADLMKNCPSQTTICGKYMFIDYLNSPTFFITTPKILRNLRRFISLSVKYYPEMLSELIRNINTGFLFLGGNDGDKIKTLRRISFIIYSCEKDTFQKDFDTIKEKAKLFLTGYKGNNKLEGEIFLMMRILFLRFSHDGVMKMIKDLWPIIFTELIENFQNESRNKHINLLIESMKFIDLLSLTNVEEFSLYQWIFLLDTINMKDLDTRDEKSLLSELLKKESKIFKPITLDILSKGNMEVNDQLIQGKQSGKSELLIIPENETLEDLQKAVKKFFYSIGDMNTYKVELNLAQIEDIIEKDFIDKGEPKKK